MWQRISPLISRLNIAASHNFPLSQKSCRSPSTCLATLYSCILSPLSSDLHVPPISHPLISPPWITQSSLRNCEKPPSCIHISTFITQFQSTFSSMHDEYTRSVYGIQYMTLFEHDIFKNRSRGFQNQDNDLLLPTFPSAILPYLRQHYLLKSKFTFGTRPLLKLHLCCVCGSVQATNKYRYNSSPPYALLVR